MFSWGAAKAPPSASNTRIPAPPPPTRQSRIRELWAGFEQWHGQAKGAADAKRVEAFRTLDKQHKSNKKNKLSKAEQEKAKEQKGREIDIELVTTARDEWQRRLGEAGFRAEDWDDMSVAETRAVERLLGDGQDVEGQAAAAAASAASSPLAGFAFVNPKALSDDEGEDAKKNIPTRVRDLPNPHLPPAPSDAALWNHTIPGYANWGIDSAASSAVSLSTIPLPSSAHSSTPSSARTSPSSGHVPLPPSFSFHAITASSASAAAATSSRPHKHRNVRYVGPVLAEEAHSEEEEEFEEFKIQVRINKILEFHDAAAQEDIQLAIKVLQARKEHKRRGTDRGAAKEAERALVLEHESRMLALQHGKETERHTLVAEEREKRRAEIMRRTQLQHALEGRALESRAHLATPTPESIRKAMEGVEEKRQRESDRARPGNARLMELQGPAPRAESARQEVPHGVEVPRAVEPSLEAARLQEALRRAEEDGRRLDEAVRRRRATTQPAETNKQLGEVLDMPGGLPLAAPTKEKEPVVVRKVEPVKKVDPTPPLAKKVEPAPAPVKKVEPVTKKGKKAAKKATAVASTPAKATTAAATPIKAPPPSPSLSSPSLSTSSSTSSALSNTTSSTSTTLTTPAPSRQDSLDDLKHPINDSQGKATGKRVAFSAAVEADQRAAAEKKAQEASWGWGSMLGSLSTALGGEETKAPTSQEKGKAKESADDAMTRQALVADLRAQAQETLADFPADTRAQVEEFMRAWPGEEGSEVGGPRAYQHVQQPSLWRPSGSSWPESKKEPDDGWSLEQLAARALQQDYGMDAPIAARAPASHIPGHLSPSHAPGGISPAHSAGTHSPAHIPGHYSPPQLASHAASYAHAQPMMPPQPGSFPQQAHYVPSQNNGIPSGHHSPPHAPAGSFSPPQAHEIWLPKLGSAKEVKKADVKVAPKPAEVKAVPKQAEVKTTSRPEVRAVGKQPEPKPKQPEPKPVAKVAPRVPEAQAAPRATEARPVAKVEARPQASAPQLASHLEKAKVKPVAEVEKPKIVLSSKSAPLKAPAPVAAASKIPPATVSQSKAPTSASVKAPVPVDNKHQIWLPQNVARPQNHQHSLTVPGSPVLQHSVTLPQLAQPTPLLAGSRLRRMSDPVSPSPRMFDRKPLPADDDVLPPTKPAVQGILKKVKGQVPAKPQANMKKPRAVPVEVIPDDEGEPRNVLPSDARSLLEPVTVAPRPSAPPHAFTQIFDYDERTGASSAQAPSQGSKAQASGDAIDGKGGMNGKDSKDGKAKHVRWTPNVMGNASPAAEAPSLQLSDPGVRQGAGKQPQGRPAMRARASMPGTGAEKQGAERAQAGKEKSGEDLQWYAVEAIENLKQQRSKPPSAV